LIDDAGFGSSSAFGGPCNTPTAELLASEGLKYNRFHTTALCSPTRQAMRRQWRSAEGTINGTYNECISLNGASALETPEFLIARLDKLGGPDSYNHYAAGWAHALDTPYQWTKQVASHFGGTRNGTIVHWPKGVTKKGEVRTQFHHVIDVAPTILEAAGRPSRSSSMESNNIPSKASAWRTRSTIPRPQTSTRHSTSRWRATAASTTRAGLR
jgi:arylsulfatase A-like enzyme